MLKLLAFLWSGCWHKWRATGGLTKVYDSAADLRADLPIYEKYRYRCERCGLVREFRT